MAPWKRTMLTIIWLLLGIISTNVYADITKAPSSGNFLEGSDVTLTCVVEGNENVVWEDFGDATLIFVGKQKNTGKKKYDNFEISSVDGDFSLIIKDVQLSDEGTYVCTDRDQLANATVTIGVLPTLHLYVKQSEATQAPQTSTEVNITCSAYNARPAVSVFELSVIGSEKTVNITNDKSNQNVDGKTYNSSATVPFMISSNDISVHCRIRTVGQSVNHTEHFNLPICNIKISGNEVRCTCQANPPVDKYRMELNGNLQDGNVLFIEESKSANVTCFGTNEMGTGRSSLLFPGNKAGFGIFPILVMILVAVALSSTCCLAVIYTKRRCSSRGEKSDEEQPNEEETNELLTPPESKQEKQQQEDEKEKQPNEAETNEVLTPPESKPDGKQQEDENDLQKYIGNILLQVNKDWEIFAIEVLNISEKVVEEAVMKNDTFANQINAVTVNMTLNHFKVSDESEKLCKKFGFAYLKDENGSFLPHSLNKQDMGLEESHEQDPTYILRSDNILDFCGTRIGKVGISKLLEAFPRSRIETDDGATLLKMFEQKDLIKKPYVNLLRKLTDCKMYGARKILLLYFKTGVQQLEVTIRNHVKNDWEIFAIEILDIPVKLVEDAVQNYDTYEDQIQVVIREITAEHIEMMDDIKSHNNLKKKNILSEFNLQSVEEEGRYYFRNLESTQSENSSNEDIICQQDPPTIESRDDMLKLCRDRIGKVGIRRFLAASTTGDIETEDETNVLEKLDKAGLINIDCSNLLSNLSDCKLFRARKIVCDYLEADLWNYINNHLCPQISLDWEIFAVEVLKLENDHVLDIIEHTNDEKEQILSMFGKWIFIYGQQKVISKQILQDLINANKFSCKILSEDNIPKNTTALKVKPTNEVNCSKEFLAMLTNCSNRIGVAGSKRFAEINSKGRILKILVVAGIMSPSSEAPEGISVDDSVNSLGQLCFMLCKANLFTARDVVITYIEKELLDEIAKISKEGASNWEKLASYGFSLSKEDVVYLERAAKSNEERVRMAISKWMRKKNIDKDVQTTLQRASKNFTTSGTDVFGTVSQFPSELIDNWYAT